MSPDQTRSVDPWARFTEYEARMVGPTVLVYLKRGVDEARAAVEAQHAAELADLRSLLSAREQDLAHVQQMYKISEEACVDVRLRLSAREEQIKELEARHFAEQESRIYYQATCEAWEQSEVNKQLSTTQQTLAQLQQEKGECVQALVLLMARIEELDNPSDQGISGHDDAVLTARAIVARVMSIPTPPSSFATSPSTPTPEPK